MDDGSSSPQVRAGRLGRTLLVVAGSVSLAVGVVGIVVPVLPTTPLLILAAICYARSSTRCYRWLISNRVFGRHLNDYLCGRGISWKVRAGTLLFLWGVITLSAVLFVEPVWAKVLLFVVAGGVTVHVATIKGRKQDDPGKR